MTHLDALERDVTRTALLSRKLNLEADAVFQVGSCNEYVNGCSVVGLRS